MTYEEARAFIDDTARYGAVLGLDSVTELMRRLGNPQDELKFVHIAGTNGKGSTLAYISTILKEAGYRVGRYISPTIFDYRERIQVNEEYITREGVARLAGQVREACEQMVQDGFSHPTTFEVETAMAFLWFREMNCDIGSLGTTHGNRLDSCIQPNVSWSRATCIHTVSIESAGIILMSATAMWSWRYMATVSVGRRLITSSGCCLTRFTESVFTTKL